MDITALASLALVTGGLTEAFKRALWIFVNKEDVGRAIPIVAVIIGIMTAILLFDLSPLQGLIAGLMTVGLYPGIKGAIRKTIQ